MISIFLASWIFSFNEKVFVFFSSMSSIYFCVSGLMIFPPKVTMASSPLISRSFIAVIFRFRPTTHLNLLEVDMLSSKLVLGVEAQHTDRVASSCQALCCCFVETPWLAGLSRTLFPSDSLYSPQEMSNLRMLKVLKFESQWTTLKS